MISNFDMSTGSQQIVIVDKHIRWNERDVVNLIIGNITNCEEPVKVSELLKKKQNKSYL